MTGRLIPRAASDRDRRTQPVSDTSQAVRPSSRHRASYDRCTACAHWGKRVGASVVDSLTVVPFYALIGIVALFAFAVWNIVFRQGRTGCSIGKRQTFADKVCSTLVLDRRR